MVGEAGAVGLLLIPPLQLLDIHGVLGRGPVCAILLLLLLGWRCSRIHHSGCSRMRLSRGSGGSQHTRLILYGGVVLIVNTGSGRGLVVGRIACKGPGGPSWCRTIRPECGLRLLLLNCGRIVCAILGRKVRIAPRGEFGRRRGHSLTHGGILRRLVVETLHHVGGTGTRWLLSLLTSSEPVRAS